MIKREGGKEREREKHREKRRDKVEGQKCEGCVYASKTVLWCQKSPLQYMILCDSAVL